MLVEIEHIGYSPNNANVELANVTVHALAYVTFLPYGYCIWNGNVSNSDARSLENCALTTATLQLEHDAVSVCSILSAGHSHLLATNSLLPRQLVQTVLVQSAHLE